MNAMAPQPTKRERALAAARRILEIEAAKEQLERELAEITAEFDSLIPDESTASRTSATGSLISLPTSATTIMAKQPSESGGGEQTLSDQLENYLAAHPGRHRAADIAEAVGGNADSIRKTLSALFNEKRITRPDRGIYCAMPAERPSASRGGGH